jgi:hypothetical protein
MKRCLCFPYRSIGSGSDTVMLERVKLLLREPLGYSSNVLGTVNAVEMARDLTAAVGAYLVVDAVHYAPHFPLNLKDLGADFVLCSS